MVEKRVDKKETLPKNYAEAIQQETNNLGIWDYLAYDKNGDLWINQLRVRDAIDLYGTPLEIVDTTIIERRCREWSSLVEETAAEVDYQGGFEYLFAAKANMSAEMAHAAYRSGWQVETSASQDLENVDWLMENGLIPADTKIYCNGFKLPPKTGDSHAKEAVDLKSGVVFERQASDLAPAVYADKIVALSCSGAKICPILDKGELAHFAQPGLVGQMEVGLRLRFGQVGTDQELAQLDSRHGFGWQELQDEAEKIAAASHLELTTFHAMAGAAEKIPVDTLVESLLFAADKYFELKKIHPSLKNLNVGGGMVPLSEDYDHQEFLARFLKGLKEKAQEANLPEPTVIFEYGSFVVAESGFHIFKVVQDKEIDSETSWQILDGGLMAAIPDMLMTDRRFLILAVNQGLSPAKRVKIGDITCDTDGRYPPKMTEVHDVLAPDTNEDLYLAILSVGAYQEVLAGIRGVHHCGLLEAAELIIEERNDGKVYGRLLPRQTKEEARSLLGYDQAGLESLKKVS